MQYVVILEEGPESWGAYVPDVPGCVAAGKTRGEVLELIRETIEFHLDEMREDGAPIPEHHSHGRKGDGFIFGARSQHEAQNRTHARCGHGATQPRA